MNRMILIGHVLEYYENKKKKEMLTLQIPSPSFNNIITNRAYTNTKR